MEQDHVSSIVDSLVNGAAAGAQNTATDAIKDAYAALKGLVRFRIAGRTAAETALARCEEEPEQARLTLEAELAAVDAGNDTAMVQLAQQLRDELDRAGATSHAGKYKVDLRESHHAQVGDGTIQINTTVSTRPPAS